jgi:sterol 24-C-methyltransferase
MKASSPGADLAPKSVFQGAVARDEVQPAVERYAERFAVPAAERGKDAAWLAKNYYQLATDFYEYGWGQSFHFAPLRRGEPVTVAIERRQHDLARKLGLGAGMKAIDVGCGVGGPMRSIARFSGADIVGITISPYQIERARRHNARAGLSAQCQLVEGDFCAMPFADATFDRAYTMEACCYAADRRGPFGEAFRVLKPGALFAGHDWCMTPRYRPTDAEHERIKLGIEKGNGVANLVTTSELVQALTDVGFEVQQADDAAEWPVPETPWFTPLASGVSFTGFRNSRVGAFLTHQIVRTLEALHASPEGTVKVHDILRLAQRALVEGGQAGIFTPLYSFVARKPE